jgi:hypothetical protein
MLHNNIYKPDINKMWYNKLFTHHIFYLCLLYSLYNFLISMNASPYTLSALLLISTMGILMRIYVHIYAWNVCIAIEITWYTRLFIQSWIKIYIYIYIYQPTFSLVHVKYTVGGIIPQLKLVTVYCIPKINVHINIWLRLHQMPFNEICY